MAQPESLASGLHRYSILPCLFHCCNVVLDSNGNRRSQLRHIGNRRVGSISLLDLKGFDLINGLADHPFLKFGNLLEPFLADGGSPSHTVSISQLLLCLTGSGCVGGDGPVSVETNLALSSVQVHFHYPAVTIEGNGCNGAVCLSHRRHCLSAGINSQTLGLGN